MEERTSGAFKGVKRWVAGFAIDVEQLRDSVPSFANTVIDELNSPETQAELMKFVLGKLEQFSEDTYNKSKMELFETLLLKYECEDKSSCQDILFDLIDDRQDAINYRIMLILFLVLLIFTFSIIFPSLKLISSYIYSTNLLNLRESKVIKFYVLKSGKWSMADVMVVAFFMAYIGFNGVVSSQLESIGRNDQSVEIFTTNGTQLMGGFYLFLSFCISSLILSEILTSKAKNTF
jgi:hypothetical protein